MIPRGGRPCGAKMKTSAESGQETGPRAETKRKSGHLGALWRRVKKKNSSMKDWPVKIDAGNEYSYHTQIKIQGRKIRPAKTRTSR
jgi:hypothetical protein